MPNPADAFFDAAVKSVTGKERTAVKFARFACATVAAFIAESLAVKAFDAVLASRRQEEDDVEEAETEED